MMLEFVLLKDVKRTEPVDNALAFLIPGGEYAFAFLKTMDLSDAIRFVMAAVVIVLLTITLT